MGQELGVERGGGGRGRVMREKEVGRGRGERGRGRGERGGREGGREG